MPPHSTLGMSEPEYSLKWKAEDGREGAPRSASPASLSRSTAKSSTPKPKGCSTQNCALENEWAFVASEYKTGEHKIEVIATDAVGNVTMRPLTVNDDPEVTSPTSGEHVSRHFRLAAAWITTRSRASPGGARLDSGKESADVPTAEVKTATRKASNGRRPDLGQSSEPFFRDVAAYGLSTADLVPPRSARQAARGIA